MEVIDQPLVPTDHAAVKYGGFWPRLGALIIDGLVLAPVTFGISYFNITSWKSSLLLILLTVVSVAYKPVMEAMCGATLGKMALKLKVVNTQFEQATAGEILLRNIFNIVPSLLTLFFTVDMFTDPEFAEITGFFEYSTFTQKFVMIQYVNYLSGALAIIDMIMLLANNQRRSLHDRIANTLVIDQS